MEQPQLPENSIEAFIDEGLAQQKKTLEAKDQSNILYHKLFKQNEDGAKLLAIWKEKALLNPSVLPHFTQFEAGLEEGRKCFIRDIMAAIAIVESENE